MLSSGYGEDVAHIIAGRGPPEKPMFRRSRFFAVLLATPLLSASGPMPDTDLSGLLTSRHLSEVATYYEQHGTERGEATPPRMTLFCAAYIYLVDFSRARACLDRFQQTIDANGGTVKIGTLVMDYSAKPSAMRAELAIDMGDFPAALAAAETSLGIARAAPPHLQREFDLLTAWQEVGLAQAFLGQSDAASQAAAEMARSVVLDNNLKRATLGPALRLGRARIFTALADYPAAARELQSPDARLDTFVSHVVDQSYLALGIDFIKARALLEQGQLAPARAGLEAILAHPQSAVSGDVLWSVRYDLGRIALAQYRDADAITQLRAALDVIERQRATIDTEASRIGFVGDKQAVYAALVATLVRLGRPAEALDIVERARSRALVDLLAGKTFAPRRGNPARVRDLLDEMNRLDRESAAPTADPAKRTGELGRVQAGLAVAAPEVLPLVTVGAAGSAEIRDRLAPDEALLEFYQDGPALYAFVTDRDGVAAATLDGAGLIEAVRRMRQAVESPDGDASAPARALYDRLIAPVASHLTGRRLITIVPHGPLHYLPFSALRGPDGYLVETFALRVLPSASVLAYLGAAGPEPARSLLVLGDPDLGDKQYDLPGAEAEARAIAAMEPDASLFLHADATKSVLLTLGSQFRRVHFAGHGQFDARNPLRSRLFLAGRTPEDGQFTANEIYDLRLNADLVTLSACETGLTLVESGDDVVGLTRGLLFAGARSIVASLWEVSDEETKFLMLAFYEALRTAPKAEALRRAQLATMRKFPNPRYWSAFQLNGAAE